ncbi:MAG TPA: adenylate/guanylate cyclase domain-containing protein [bacterium]
MPEFDLDSLDWEIPMKEVLQDIPYYGIFISDLSGKILFWNRGVEMLTGYTHREILGRSPVGKLLKLSDMKGKPLYGKNDPLGKCVASGMKARQKVQVTTKSKNPFVAIFHFLPIKDRHGNSAACMAFFHDVSQEADMILTQKKVNTSLKQYVSKAAYREAITKAVSNRAVKPEILNRTVLFMDMAGFTAFAEKTTPEGVIQTLNELLSLCGEAVRECHGDIDKFIGDSLMAVFSDPNNAVRAALQIRVGLFKLNDLREKKGKKPIEVRMGMNTGRLIRGEIGSFHRKELTVIGDVVNTASRVQTKAEPGEILITQATYDLIKTKRDCFPAGKVSLKGKKQLVTIYRIGGLASVDLPWIPKFLRMMLRQEGEGALVAKKP